MRLIGSTCSDRGGAL